mgnify:CR=1 FL=1
MASAETNRVWTEGYLWTFALETQKVIHHLLFLVWIRRMVWPVRRRWQSSGRCNHRSYCSWQLSDQYHKYWWSAWHLNERSLWFGQSTTRVNSHKRFPSAGCTVLPRKNNQKDHTEISKRTRYATGRNGISRFCIMNWFYQEGYLSICMRLMPLRTPD